MCVQQHYVYGVSLDISLSTRHLLYVVSHGWSRVSAGGTWWALGTLDGRMEGVTCEELVTGRDGIG